MLGRLLTAAALALLVGAGCYDVPTPDCGFACGPDAACPGGYTCAATDGRCHRDGADPALVCGDAPPITPGTGPTIVSVQPASSARDVPRDGAIEARFSEDVTGVTAATFFLVSAPDGGLVPTGVTYDPVERIAVLVPVDALRPGSFYRAVLTGTIVDADGLGLQQSGGYTWTFTTVDDVPPEVAFVSPAASATQVPVTTTIQVTFTEQMLGLATGLELRDASSAVVPSTVSVSPNLASVTLTPDAPLAPGATYTASVAGALTDTAGLPLVGAPIAWMFTTFQDVTAPVFIASAPMPGDVDVPVTTDIRVAVDEPVQGADAASVRVSTGGAPITGVVTTGFAGAQIVFTPDAALPAGAIIDVTLTTAITDLAGNALVAPIALSFTTAP